MSNKKNKRKKQVDRGIQVKAFWINREEAVKANKLIEHNGLKRIPLLFSFMLAKFYREYEEAMEAGNGN